MPILKAEVNKALRCQDMDGEFLPIATICTNKKDFAYCLAMFPINASDPDGRPPKCDMIGKNMKQILSDFFLQILIRNFSDAADEARNCAKHCKLCCELKEHGCGDTGSEFNFSKHNRSN